jgi:hypothetical protein
VERDDYIIQALVDIADNLVDTFDVVDLLIKLTDRCVEILGISAAGVMLAMPTGELRLIASSSEAMQLVELFELQIREGPCLEAFNSGEQVNHENLDEGYDRWPRFSEVARQAGFRSASAIPMRLRDATIGALNLFSFDVRPMDERDVIVARGFADLATISVLQHDVASEAHRVNDQLSHALVSRIAIEQAKGVIAERAGVGMDEAFSRLRNYARSHSVRLAAVAQAAVEGTLDPAAWEAPPVRGS